jgi:hypothetical protein
VLLGALVRRLGRADGPTAPARAGHPTAHLAPPRRLEKKWPHPPARTPGEPARVAPLRVPAPWSRAGAQPCRPRQQPHVAGKGGAVRGREASLPLTASPPATRAFLAPVHVPRAASLASLSPPLRRVASLAPVALRCGYSGLNFPPPNLLEYYERLILGRSLSMEGGPYREPGVAPHFRVNALTFVNALTSVVLSDANLMTACV